MSGIPIATAGRVIRSLLLLGLLLPAVAADAALWGSRGITQAFAVVGARVYIADGRGVSLYDVSDPAAIRRLDVEIGDDESHDVAVSGDDLVVLATDGGIEWFTIATDGTLTRAGRYAAAGAFTDVSAAGSVVAAGGSRNITIFDRSPQGLQRRRTITTQDTARSLEFVGGLLYAAFEHGGITIYDPSSGARVESILTETPAIALDGGVLWIASGQTGIHAYDVSDPSNPTPIVRRFGALEIQADDVAAGNGKLYVRDGHDLVRIYDVTDPLLPVQTSSIEEWVHVMLAEGDLLLIAGTVYDHENLPSPTGVPLRVFDIGSGSAPRIAGEFRDLAGPVSGVFTDGSIAYVVDPPFLRTIDVSRTADPREMASIRIPGIQDSIRVKNGLAVIYGRSDVNLVDVSDPWNLRFLGTWDAEGHPPSSAALLRDTFVEANEHSGLHIVDYSDPARPVQIAGRIFHYHDVAAGDDAVYALQQIAFLTLDLTDRTKVVDRQVLITQYLQIDSIPPNSAYPTHLVLTRHDGVEIWSLVPDRFQPRRIAFTTLTRPGIFGTSESAAFVAYEGTLRRVDTAGAVTPTGLRVTSPMQISAAGEKLVVADRYALRVYGSDTAPPPPAPDLPPAKRRAVGRAR